MEHLSLAVPGVWADHHVLAVLDLLRGEQGVTDGAASALDGTLTLRYDPKQTDPARIIALLESAGYSVGEATAEAAEAPGAVAPEAAADAQDEGDAPAAAASGWASGLRVTTTDPADLSMSGDHRKY
jgi:hypothetical protein